ncbi:MAG: hypothetical protein Q4E57_06960 [Eubacteriales bacterium]|nr:hypothetical protein [Eubacteriales bacterium]
MKLAAKILLGIAGTVLAIAIIMGVTTASVIGIKALYQKLNPVSDEVSVQSDFQVGDTITDVMGFTSNVEEYTKHIGR